MLLIFKNGSVALLCFLCHSEKVAIILHFTCFTFFYIFRLIFKVLIVYICLAIVLFFHYISQQSDCIYYTRLYILLFRITVYFYILCMCRLLNLNLLKIKKKFESDTFI